MPVMVTGAGSGLGARVVDRLLPTGGQVRAYLDATRHGDDDAVALRDRGCKVAVGELDDEAHLEAALAQAHTVVHCWGGPLDAPGVLVDAAATVASAALGAGVRRWIWVRELATGDDNPYLAAQAAVASVVDALPIETVTVATGLRVAAEDPFTARLRAGWLSGSGVDGTTPHTPVHLDDVARAVALADRDRSGATGTRVRLGLVGPRTMTLGELLDAVGAPPLDGPAPADPPPSWLADWLSRPATGMARGGLPTARGAEPVEAISA